MRLEPLSGPSESSGANTSMSYAGVLIVGYKDHPTIANTNIQRGDRFKAGGQNYEVKQVLPDTPSRLLAFAEAREA